jgi:hypothetical protein
LETLETCVRHHPLNTYTFVGGLLIGGLEMGNYSKSLLTRLRNGNGYKRSKALLDSAVYLSEPTELEVWLDELFDHIKQSFESGQVSRFGAFFMENVRGGRWLLSQGDDMTRAGWAEKGIKGAPARYCLARYAHVGTIRGRSARAIYAVAADYCQKIAKIAEVDDQEKTVGPWVKSTILNLPDLPKETQRFMDQLNKCFVVDMWKEESLTW